ncbi:hypothetical protein V5T82_09890 [Magnetovibrio sp. PR-2]|uniref:hypothetical protein n=1 Tax=Magnetovibrio sp. PR-2 TaxID=3120356 RepID=UPI002FCE44E5
MHKMLLMTTTALGLILSQANIAHAQSAQSNSNLKELGKTLTNIAKVANATSQAGQKVVNSGGQALSDVISAGGKAGARALHTSNEIENLEVTQQNTVSGSVNLNNNSQANLGNVSLQNTKLKDLKITTTNSTQSMNIRNNSSANLGNVNVQNLKGSTAIITTENTVRGTINASNNSHLNMGNFTSQ